MVWHAKTYCTLGLGLRPSSETEEVYYPFLKYILSRVYDSISRKQR